MPSLEIYKKMLSGNGNTIGQVHKNESDKIMEFTWDRDVASKLAYIYDYYHDDEPLKRMNFSYENTRKTPVQVKHYYNLGDTMSKDKPEMYLQFKPSQKMYDFDEEDELYYYQRDFVDKYFATFPVGLVI